jgi:hypothetical protein
MIVAKILRAERRSLNSIGVTTSSASGKSISAVETKGCIWFRPQGTTLASSSLRWNSSSGDGLGNHQPGSITWGGQVRTPAPSGRARDRARCPAVARSDLRRAA